MVTQRHVTVKETGMIRVDVVYQTIELNAA